MSTPPVSNRPAATNAERKVVVERCGSDAAFVVGGVGVVVVREERIQRVRDARLRQAGGHLIDTG